MAEPPSMHTLEPVPTHDPADDAQGGEKKPPALPPTATLGLRAPTLAQVQRYSSYVFSAFAAMHVANTALLPLALRSAPAATPYLLLTRPFYQSWPLAEPALVLAPLAAHIASGLLIRGRRAAVLQRRYGGAGKSAPIPPVSAVSASGFVAALLVAGHAALSRGLPAYVDGGSSVVGLDFVGHGVARGPAPALGALGFGALVAAAGAHMVWGWATWLGVKPGRAVPGEPAAAVLRRKRRWWGVWGATAAVVGLWMAGGVGVVALGGRADGWVGATYDRIYEGAPLVGRFL